MLATLRSLLLCAPALSLACTSTINGGAFCEGCNPIYTATTTSTTNIDCGSCTALTTTYDAFCARAACLDTHTAAGTQTKWETMCNGADARTSTNPPTPNTSDSGLVTAASATATTAPNSNTAGGSVASISSWSVTCFPINYYSGLPSAVAAAVSLEHGLTRPACSGTPSTVYVTARPYTRTRTPSSFPSNTPASNASAVLSRSRHGVTRSPTTLAAAPSSGSGCTHTMNTVYCGDCGPQYATTSTVTARTDCGGCGTLVTKTVAECDVACAQNTNTVGGVKTTTVTSCGAAKARMTAA